jgi:hypothetical protein
MWNINGQFMPALLNSFVLGNYRLEAEIGAIRRRIFRCQSAGGVWCQLARAMPMLLLAQDLSRFRQASSLLACQPSREQLQ